METQLAEYVGVHHCITCANGTDALSLAMMAWGIVAGDAVFVPDFTFFSLGEIVSFAGATPIFVDVEEETFNSIAMCLICGCGIFLSDDKDSKDLMVNEIIMKSAFGSIIVYNRNGVVDRLKEIGSSRLSKADRRALGHKRTK